MAKFPDDLIGDILLCLSVKPLLRFMCVCKTWCALIDNNNFVRQHLNHSAQTNSKHKLILQNGLVHYSVGLYSLTDQPIKLVPPIYSTHTVLGHCNGLLCFQYDFYIGFLLWNPATRKHLNLPLVESRHSLDPQYGFVYGFGYDSVSDDYKVVKVFYPKKVLNVHQFLIDDDNSLVSETNVYNLRSNSWRIIEGVTPCLIGSQRPAALACGALHWLGSEKSDSSPPLIVAFNLATEEYMMITLPYLPTDVVFTMLVKELGGCLSICVNCIVGVDHVWVMKDYGVSESWTKLLTLSSLGNFRNVIPLAYSERGDEVLLAMKYKKLIWYNLEKRTYKVVDASEISTFCDPVVCLESLVSLGEKAESDEEAEESEEEVI